MKRITFALVALFVSINVFCQQQVAKSKVEEISNAEKFSDRSGTLIKKEFESVGNLNKCLIQIALYTDLISGQKSTAVRFEYEHQSSYSSDTKIALLDADEIDGLIKSLKIIQEKILPTSISNYTEVSFRSRSGFSAGCFSKKDSWSAYMKLERYDSDSYVWLDKDDLSKLLNLMEQAKLKL